jgi:hypothetical protein
MVLIAPAHTESKWQGVADETGAEVPPLYAKGCYWHQGTRYCSAYCYIEINGKRYCNERQSEAVPQGNPYSAERPTLDDVYRQPR